MSVLLLEAARPRLRSKFAGAVRPAKPPKRPSRRPWLGRFSYSSYSVFVGAFKRSLALRDIRQCLLLAIRASRQAVKRGLGESDIQRALEIERSFEKLFSSVDAECYAGRILMGWRNVNRTNRSAKIIDNNNAFVIDSDRFQELAGRQ
jgi:hypothetical protein